MKPSSGDSAPEASMSRSDTSRGVSAIVSSESRSSGRSPVRSTNVPPCGSIRPLRVPVTVTVPGRRSRGHLFFDQAQLGQLSEDLLRALIGRRRLGVDAKLGALGCLVRIRDAGELLDLTGERLRVEALHVALGASIDRRIDVNLDEATELLNHLSRLGPGLGVRRDRRHDHGAALPGEPGGDPADALDVRVAVLLREPEPLREVLANRVPVQILDDPSATLELGADDLGDRRLSSSRQTGKPERKARTGLELSSAKRTGGGGLGEPGGSLSTI